MMSLEQLLQGHCEALRGAPLPHQEIEHQLSVLPEWRHDAGALRRAYAFRDYFATIAFVNALAWMVHREDHHPELAVHYNRCDVAFHTHSVGGISRNDFICAAKADALYAQRPGA
jgi:4a-hydroxytetrahydrobiopterin dehydratase